MAGRTVARSGIRSTKATGRPRDGDGKPPRGRRSRETGERISDAAAFGSRRKGRAAVAGSKVRAAAVEKVKLSDKLGRFQDHWSPKAVGAVNDFLVKLVKLKGEFVWHSHDVEDELFLVLRGRLRMQLRDREVLVDPGEFIVVPHGTEHRPVADEEVHVLLLEPKSTRNTGTTGGTRTREVEWI